MPLNDHVLLLQLERANEALSDRVEAVEDTDPDPCDCDCHESDVDRLEDDIRTLREQLVELTGICVGLAEKVEALEKRNTEFDHRLWSMGG